MGVCLLSDDAIVAELGHKPIAACVGVQPVVKGCDFAVAHAAIIGAMDVLGDGAQAVPAGGVGAAVEL